MNRIIVFGSINTDFVISADRLPKMGESIFGNEFNINFGGKGANQAVAASKLGAKTIMVGAVGDDAFGKENINNLRKFKVNADNIIFKQNQVTGCAMITVVGGDNEIIVNRGANHSINLDEVGNVINKEISKGDIFITQQETPLNIVQEMLKLAKGKGAFTILNPAPAGEFDKNYYKYVDLLIPNETEASLIVGGRVDTDEEVKNVAKKIKELGVNKVIITLGGRGCYFDGKIYPTNKVDVVDTTAAGDTFIGGFASEYLRTKDFIKSIDFGQKASQITVTRRGAQITIPTIEEIR